MTDIAILKDLRPMFGAVRDQGARPTCLAFAASDTHAALRDGWIELSSEYIFYQAQSLSGKGPLEGSTISSVLQALRTTGQPTEEMWPYQQSSPASAWRPPNDVGDLYLRNGEIVANLSETIVSEIEQERPVVVAMTLSMGFFSPPPFGLIARRDDDPPSHAHRHALAVVAIGLYDTQRIFLVRNSWGSSWGLEGYAWLTEDYIQTNAFQIAVLKEAINVPPCSLAA